MKLKSINQKIRQATRSIKDLLLPWRKKRREQWVHVGQQIGLIHAQLSETRQSIVQVNQTAAGTQQSLQNLVHQVEQNQSRSREENTLQQTKQKSQFQSVHQRIDKLALQTEQLLSHVQETDAASSYHQDVLKLQLNQQDLATARSFDQQTRLELRLVELEKEVILLREPGSTHRSQLESLQARLDSVEARAADNHTQLDQFLLRLEREKEQLADQLEQVTRQVATLKQTPPKRPAAATSDVAQRVETASKTHTAPSAPTQSRSQFCPAAFDFYSNLNDQSPFVYLDVKSIPRSGLHYLQDVLRNVLGKSMSFCEWYQEPGCCRQMPCAVTGFAQACCELGNFGVRMIKSHDFDLVDPIFPTTPSLRRIVLLRDPVFCLTSYWNLQSLKYNQDLLRANGINPTKVDYLHEKPVLQMAYRLIDSQGTVPAETELVKFLEQTKKYMLGFVGKWGRHVPDNSIVRYEDVTTFAVEFLQGLAPRLPAEARERLEALKNQPELQFNSRTSPFVSVSQKLSDYLAQFRELFQNCADEIKREDATGWFARCCTEQRTSSAVEPAFETKEQPLKIAG